MHVLFTQIKEGVSATSGDLVFAEDRIVRPFCCCEG